MTLRMERPLKKLHAYVEKELHVPTSSRKPREAAPARTRLRAFWGAAAQRHQSPSSLNHAFQISNCSPIECISRTTSTMSDRGNEFDDVAADGELPLQATARGLDVTEYLAQFRAVCIHRYRSLVRAWRLLLDPKVKGRIPFIDFSGVVKSVGFKKARTLFIALDINCSGFLTLDLWDTLTYRNVMEFRRICYSQFGGLELAFNLSMDNTGSGTVTFPELQKFCVASGFSGDVRVLMTALDVDLHGYICLPDLDFVLNCEGERFPQIKDGSRSTHLKYGSERLQIGQMKKDVTEKELSMHHGAPQRNTIK